jgi:hypothetical protein
VLPPKELAGRELKRTDLLQIPAKTPDARAGLFQHAQRINYFSLYQPKIVLVCGSSAEWSLLPHASAFNEEVVMAN